MSQPFSLGRFNGYTVFSVDGLFYKTTATITSDVQARALVASGQAIQQFESYQAQFPWLYEADGLVTESGNGGANGVNLITENGVDLWA